MRPLRVSGVCFAFIHKCPLTLRRRHLPRRRLDGRNVDTVVPDACTAATVDVRHDAAAAVQWDDAEADALTLRANLVRGEAAKRLWRLLRDAAQERRLADARDTGHQENVFHNPSHSKGSLVRIETSITALGAMVLDKACRLSPPVGPCGADSRIGVVRRCERAHGLP